jgi:ABC-type multidrug transport system fused ATPase/permease subunit
LVGYDLAVRGLAAGWRPGKPALRDVSFSVPAGTRAAIVGPSGAGKTTLAMVLLRFLDYSPGVLTLGGADVTGSVDQILRLARGRLVSS